MMSDAVIRALFGFIGTIFGGLVTLWGTQKNAQVTEETDKEKILIERDEGVYRGISLQIELLQKDNKEIRKELTNVKDELRRVKKEHREELKGYRQYTKDLQSKYEKLKRENRDLRNKIRQLKGERSGN